MNTHVSYTFEAALIFAGICSLMCILLASAFRFGLRRAESVTDKAKSILEMLQNALLTLVALLLAFGVSMAEISFETRVQNLATEGNAFSTAWLRATLLPMPVQKKFRNSLIQNLEARIDFYTAAGSKDVQASIQKKTDDIQSFLWQLVANEARINTASTSLPLVIQSLNETFDIQETQTRSYNNHLPFSIMVLLAASSMLVITGVGAICGINRTRILAYTNLLALLIAMTLFVIFDLDRPRGGMIQIHPNNLIEHLKNFRRAS